MRSIQSSLLRAHTKVNEKLSRGRNSAKDHHRRRETSRAISRRAVGCLSLQESDPLTEIATLPVENGGKHHQRRSEIIRVIPRKPVGSVPYPRNDQDMTNPNKARSASQNVFETTELLEQIISYLPMKKIFTVQSVSHHWKNTIGASPGLQQRMWLRIKPGPIETWPAWQFCLAIFDWKAIINPERSIRFETITPVAVNPGFRLDEGCWTRNLGINHLEHEGKVVLHWGPAKIRQQFSFLDTFITDPPCKTAEIRLTVHFRKPDHGYFDNTTEPEYPLELLVSSRTVSSEKGLTLQDLLCAALNTRRRNICQDQLNLPVLFGLPGYAPFHYGSEISLREAIALLPQYTGIKRILDCPVFEARIVLLDDVATPTPEQWATISAASS